MTPAELRARTWCGAACAAAQVAATAAGMLPWWALPFTLALTVAVSLPAGPVNQTRARLTRIAGVAAVAAFTTIIAMRSISQGREGLIDPTATLRSLTEALVVLSLIMAPNARTPREHRVWLTVTLGVLVAAAAGGRSPGQGVMAVVSWIVVLIATSRVQVTDAYANGAVPAVIVGVPANDRPSLLARADATIPIVATLVAGAIVYFALPAGLGGGDLARRLASHVQQSNLTLADRDQIGVDTRGFGALSLLVRGELPDTPLLKVPADSPVLWRATFYRFYTGTSWENSDLRVESLHPVPGPSAAVPRIADDPPARGGVTRTDRVEVEPGADADLIWAPGVPVKVAGQPDEVRDIVRGNDNVRVFGQPGQPLTSYTVTSVVAPTSPKILTGRSRGGPGSAVWTSLPTSLPAEVASLAHEITAGASNRYQAVSDIERYLRGHEQYSLVTPVPSPNADAVDDFLFHTHVGFCEIFASAEAVMLRSLGIPARLVTGLAYGATDGATRLYTAANAHAWVEVYYPGVGWSPSDPTAGSQLATTATAKKSVFTRAFDAVAGALPGGRIALAVIGAALLVGVGGVARRVINTRRGKGGSRRRDARPPGPVLGAFLRMTANRHGPPPRAPAETARQYLARVGGRRPDIAAAAVVLEQELYGESPPGDVETLAAIEAFESLVSPTPTPTPTP
ncbi:MAG TPA: transglutaminase domain-containing protein [Mycobacteriales bacterium]|nr:transglutaminase domain-containing protein [Mycobacteriales bacterium]